ncbi:MAG: ATP-dependent helicase HrpB [Deltaproteobacteria bacterium HGW-Deltaproteobacteria-22]|nr:MAG: ATP-dependent helicase HrpB [Deltaproteobacteria bacterium HGW-Deltaproteobacteria-22]
MSRDPHPDALLALPVFHELARIRALLETEPVIGLEAEAGAGKSTLVPWDLLSAPGLETSRIILVQPRALAVFSLAERIADLLGETPGDTVGYRTREATKVGPKTRLEIMTWGVFLRIVQDAPELDGVGAVILDEFHERHWQGDLCWAFLREIRALLRPDLRVLFFSTDLPAQLHEFPVLRISGRQFPVEMVHAPVAVGQPADRAVAAVVRNVITGMNDPASLARGGGCVLAFLPGKAEIERCLRELAPLAQQGVELFGLHRGADHRIREVVFAPVPAGRRRVVVATNIAETSLTLPDVKAVVDSGLERRFEFSPRTGLSHMTTVRISQLSATQRAGRAGRLGPGSVVRLWPAAEKLDDFPEPEILHADPLSLELELALWGDTNDLKFITPPRPASRAVASSLLRDLGFLDKTVRTDGAGSPGRITDRGRKASRMGVHPRLAAMILGAPKRAMPTACLLAALLEEDLWQARDPERVSLWVPMLLRASLPERLQKAVSRVTSAAGIHWRAGDVEPALCGRLLAAAYPDRVGRVDPANPKRLVLVSGRAGLLPDPQEPGSLAVAVFADGGETNAKVSLYEPCTLDDVLATGTLAPEKRTTVDFKGWSVTGRTRTLLGQIQLDEKIAAPDRPTLQAAVAARLSANGFGDLLTGPKTTAALTRLRLASAFSQATSTSPTEWPVCDDTALLASVADWLLPHVRFVQGPVLDDALMAHALIAALPAHLAVRLKELTPDHLTLPSKRRVRVDYESGPVPVIAARLQDFFGCRKTPQICGKPVLLHLLSPANRPVQVTSDLAGFWKNSYPMVRKELAGRYPKHNWPLDP